MSTPSLPERLRHAASAPWPRADLLCAAAQRIEALTEGRDCTRAAMQGYRARALDAEQRVAELEDECRGLRAEYTEAVERAWPEGAVGDGDMNGALEALETRAGADFLRALDIDGFRAQPQLGAAARSVLDDAERLGALAVRVGEEIDARLVATDPDGMSYPAARERVRERQAAAAAATRAAQDDDGLPF